MITTVSTVKDDLPRLERWIERNLAAGVDRMLVFVDDRDDTQTAEALNARRGVVAVASIAGSAIGAVSAHAVLGSLSLELVTGQPGAPSLVVPWWSALSVPALAAVVVVVAVLELRATRRRALAGLLRS